MRILALDIGDARIGCAISDPQERVATPLCVLPAAEVMGNAASFRRVLQDWEPDLILAGLPYTMAHAQGPQAQRVREKAQSIAAATKLPLEFTDERLSSQEAKRSLREKGFSEREMRGKIDMIAASLFLQAWLDARALQA
ncbi:MAG: Holliday junction resolvase RuvX [Raoultibacter sp.]